MTLAAGLDDDPAFRPVQYLGTKWRLLDAIEGAIAAVAPEGSGRICDLFAGTGVVASRLASRWDVVANDIQEYARVLASAQLVPTRLTISERRDLHHHAQGVASELEPPLRSLEALEALALAGASDNVHDLGDLLEHGSVMAHRLRPQGAPDGLRPALDEASTLDDSLRSVLSRYYGGVYFSYAQARELDGLATAIRRLPVDRRDTPLAALLSTASDLSSTVGSHFAQPVRPRDGAGRLKVGPIRSILSRRHRSATATFVGWLDRYERMPVPRHRATAIRADYRRALADLPQGLAAVYADPPYTRDHYSRYYHVLETIALGDEPGLSTTTSQGVTTASRGLYRTDRHQSPFCIKTQAPGAFTHLFGSVADHGVPLVLSYSPFEASAGARPRLLPMDQLVDLAEASFRSVSVTSAGRVAHSKFNAAHLNVAVNYEAELLITCRP